MAAIGDTTRCCGRQTIARVGATKPVAKFDALTYAGPLWTFSIVPFRPNRIRGALSAFRAL